MSYYEAELPAPSVEVAERMLTVLKAFRLNRGTLRPSWEWIRILEAAAVNEKFPLSSGTNFFRYILESGYYYETEGEPTDARQRSKEVYELISPYIELSATGKARIIKRFGAIEAKKPAGVW